MSSETVTTDREIVLTRLLDAPRELVWKAWTEPEHLIKWWGPDGFTNTFHEIDVRTGGEWRFVMHGPDGTDYDNFVRFLEVVQPERIVYDQGTGPDNLMFRGSATFEVEGERTRVTLRTVFPSREARDRVIERYGAIAGGEQTLRRLAEYLESM